MSQTAYELQLTEVTEDGSEKLVYPINTSKEVITGTIAKSEGELKLPGSNNKERLEQTIGYIKGYLANLTAIAQVARNVVDDPADNSENLPSTKATSALKSALDNMNTIVEQNKAAIETKAPIMHADAEKTYGGGTSTNYGHVKTSDQYTGFDEETPASAADDSVVASQKALVDAYKALDGAKAPVSHAVEDTTYGSATSLKYGHVKTSDTYKVALENADADHGVVASQKALAEAYAELSGSESGLAGKAQTMHADADRIYGVGTGELYGHLKISDDFDLENIEEIGSAAAGMAASLFALHRSNEALQTAIDTKIGTHAAEKATAETFSHVKLTDEYSSNNGAADSGVGASSKALSDLYADLKATIDTTQKSIVTLNSGMAYQSSHTEFNSDGSITKTTSNSTKKTSFNSDGSITNLLTITDEGGLLSSTTKIDTVFNSDGTIDDKVTITTE